MTNADLYRQWDVLCKEFHAARDAEWAAFIKVNTKFRAFWNDESAEGPTIQELDEREAASARLKDVETCMDAFCKKNA